MEVSTSLQEEWQVTEEEVEVKQAFEGAFKSLGVDLPSSFQPQHLALFEKGSGNPIAGLFEAWVKATRMARKSPKTNQKFTGRSSSTNTETQSETITRDLECGEVNRAKAKQEGVTCEEGSLAEQLGRASELDVSQVDWSNLFALYRTEHSEGSPGDEAGRSACMEVNVNSGGVVYFALFYQSGERNSADENNHEGQSMAAACLKFTPSRLATQSEKLGSELARHLSVATPQARVVHSCSPEFADIERGVTRAQEKWKAAGNDGARSCWAEFLEALQLSRCLFIMGYVHGRPLLKCPEAFRGQEKAEKVSSSLGRVLLLDLVLRNPDRLVCSRLGWRGNPGNLFYTRRPILASPIKSALAESKDGSPKPRGECASPVHGASKSEVSDNGPTKNSGSQNRIYDTLGTLVVIDSGICRRPPSKQAAQDRSEYVKLVELILNDTQFAGNVLYEISGGHLGFPEVSGDGERETVKDEGEEVNREQPNDESVNHEKAVQVFQGGFREAIADLETLQVVLQTLRKRLDEMLRAFIAYVVAGEEREEKSEGRGERLNSPNLPPRSSIHPGSGKYKKRNPSHSENSKNSTSPKTERERREWKSEPDCAIKLKFASSGEANPDSPVAGEKDRGSDEQSAVNHVSHEQNPAGKEGGLVEEGKAELSEKYEETHEVATSAGDTKEDCQNLEKASVQEGADKGADWHSTPQTKVSFLNDPSPSSEDEKGQKIESPSREKWYQGVGSLPSRLTMKIRGVNQSIKGDDQLKQQLTWWNGVIRGECQKICDSYDFTTGFLERGTMSLVDSYELKVRLEHVLERASLVLKGSATERPSEVLPGIFIGGAVAARSEATLLHLGISKILNLCPMELCDPIEEKEFSPFSCLHIPLQDVDKEDISVHLDKACDYIESEQKGGNKVLVHCFEGRSRSAAIVIAYLMIRRSMSLAEAWSCLKSAHPRARPNDGFMKTLTELDKKLRGTTSMEWKPRKPLARTCHLCQKMVGFSSDSLLFHMKMKHPGTLMKADGATVVVVDAQLQDSSQTSTPTKSSLDKMEASIFQASPEDKAKMQLLAVAGISEPSQ